jgi:hypothetical protein
MAHYAYKHVCYDIDCGEFNKYIKKFEKESGHSCDMDASSNGDYWYVVELWIRDLLKENKQLKQKRNKQ